ncbi:MAG: hypothetical protein KF863_23265 [Rubrivivax sp.]|nr:hypothetical protein [Rubrivivax sp.]
MPPPINNLETPEKVLREIFDEDRWVKDEFANHLAADLTQLAEVLAACFRQVPNINEAANRAATKQAALVAAFLFGILDDLLVSTKLLVSGKLLASGNVMRQAIEGVAVSILCSADELVVIKKHKNNPTLARYWERVEADDARTRGHHAIDQLSWNAVALRVNLDSVTRLQRSKAHYNTFSHAGPFAIAGRVALGEPGLAFAGGHFDPAKLQAYQMEIRERIGLCRILPQLIEQLVSALKRPAARGEA